MDNPDIVFRLDVSQTGLTAQIYSGINVTIKSLISLTYILVLEWDFK
jgi:hypothetical protein